MEHLTGTSVEQLQRALDEVEGKKPTQRLTVAIAYKHGISQTELARWYDVERRTIYNWLRRLENEPLEHAVADRERGGRPRKLSDAQQTQLEDVLQEPPTAAGFDSAAWSPTLVRRYLEDEFGVDYSLPSCRRLMKEAGLRYRESREAVTEATDPSDSTGGPGRRGRWVSP